MSEGVTIKVPEEAWEVSSPEDKRLRCTLYINGVPHHMEAWPVNPPPKDGAIYNQRLLGCAWLESAWNDFCAFVEPDSPFETVKIRGRYYAVIVSPFCS